jgi:SMODS-associating 2TM, beta-strand rich effector domain
MPDLRYGSGFKRAMQDHEYALVGGVNRAKIGRYITLTSAIVSAGIVFVLLSAVDVAKRYNIPVNLPPVVLSLVGAGSVFVALYWIFDRFLWRLPGIGRLLNVPNLSGDWHCDGQTLNPDKTPGYVWQGTVTIAQSWDKIRLHLVTKSSASDSVAAAITYDSIDGYHLLYHYRNTPAVTSTDLAAHRGFAELNFSKDLRTATGDYFNGGGRFTFGTMRLRKN